MKKYLTFFQKYSPPILNLMIILGVGIILAPFQPLPPKVFLIIIFLLYSLVSLFFNNNRDLGMALVGTNWKESYPQTKQFIFVIANTLSFASIFYHVFFPFDLLLFNLVLLQVPSLFYGGMYFPQYIAGKMQMSTNRLP